MKSSISLFFSSFFVIFYLSACGQIAETPVTLTLLPSTKPLQTPSLLGIVLTSSPAPMQQKTIRPTAVRTRDSTSTPKRTSVPSLEPSSTFFPETRLVLSDGESVFVMDGTGENHRLISKADYILAGSISADGQWVAYVSDYGELSIANIDTLKQKRLPVLGDVLDQPVFSPDGQWLAYMSNRAGRHRVHLQSWDYDIVLIKVDGSEQRVLVENKLSNEFPTWSPDSKNLAYFSIDRVGAGNEMTGIIALNIMEVETRKTRQIYKIQLGWAWARGLSWSPDGRFLVYGLDTPQGYAVFMINPKGGGFSQVTPYSSWVSGVAWLPDSQHILYWDEFSATFKVVDAFSGQPMSPEPAVFAQIREYGKSFVMWSSPIQFRDLPDCTSGWTRLKAGGFARVSGESTTPNRLRVQPSRNGEIIGQIFPAVVVKLLEGPVCADGFIFWKVQYDNNLGWTAEGDGQEYWLESYQP